MPDPFIGGIPEPRLDLASVHAAVVRMKNVVETLGGLRGDDIGRSARYEELYGLIERVYSLERAVVATQVPGYLYGLTISNDTTDPTNDIDIAVGAAVDSNALDLIRVSVALTKRLDAAWAAGNNAGGRMSAAAIADVTYHVFVIKNPTNGSVDVGFDVSPTAPTLPAGYTLFRRIASIRRAAGVITPFTQYGDRFIRKVMLNEFATSNPGTSAITVTLAGVPVGIVVDAILVYRQTDASALTNGSLLITSLDDTDTAASLTAFTYRQAGNVGATGISGSGVVEITTNTAAQIRYRLDFSDADVTIRMLTMGWNDRRGQDG